MSHGTSFDQENERWVELPETHNRRDIPDDNNGIIKPEHLINGSTLKK